MINRGFGGTAEEVPDCSHPDFGPHITQTFDSTLNTYVFDFSIHVTPDNDRCINFDRQRNEIKTNSNSLVAFQGDEDSVLASEPHKLRVDHDVEPRHLPRGDRECRHRI